jgi:hypothetical protein
MSKRRGFALADVAVAIGLLGVLFTVLYGGEVSVRRQANTLEYRARALFLAQEYMELTCDQFPTIPPLSWQSKVFGHGDGITGIVDVKPCAKFPTLRTATLTVTWTDPEGGPEHRMVLSRLVPDRVTSKGTP